MGRPVKVCHHHTWNNCIKHPTHTLNCVHVLFLDIDECNIGGLCDIVALCNNTDGGYTCQCQTGYSGDGTMCEGHMQSTAIH